ncbi:MAG: helix-turn-helix domain-containing protein [Candidatus Omnitrophota bacterium]
MRRKTNKEKDVLATGQGESLRKLREAKGIRLEQASQKTKIHLQTLKAMEGDAVSNMAPAYIKGLLKIYCAFLGINPNDFIQRQVDTQQPKKSETPDSTKVETDAVPLTKPHVNISVIKRNIKIKPFIFIIFLLVLGIVIFRFSKGIFTSQTAPLEELADKVSILEPDILPSATGVETKLKLGIRAKEDCWVEVKIDGKTIFSNVLKKSYFEEWQADKEIEFSLGNAGGVDVKVNDKLLPPFGRRGQVVKKIRITKQGLTVPE